MSALRQAVRQLVRHPGTTLVAALALALGIGLATFIFSFVNSLLFKTLPFDASDQLFVPEMRDPKTRQIDAFRAAELPGWRKEARSFEAFGGFTYINTSGSHTPDLEGATQTLFGSQVTANFLELLRVQPLLGRGFLPGEDQREGPRVALLSYRVWQRDSSGDPGILNRTIRLDGESATVIGVMPEGFRFPFMTDVWTNLRWGDRAGPMLMAFVRLKPGVSPASAQAELNVLGPWLAQVRPNPLPPQLAQRMPQFNQQYTQVELRPFVEYFARVEPAPPGGRPPDWPFREFDELTRRRRRPEKTPGVGGLRGVTGQRSRRGLWLTGQRSRRGLWLTGGKRHQEFTDSSPGCHKACLGSGVNGTLPDAWLMNDSSAKLCCQPQITAPSLAVIPTDVRRWVSDTTLVGWVLGIVSDIAPADPGAVAASGSSEAVPVRTMLTLLIYCYATGRYGSEEIEASTLTDRTVRYLCGTQGPTSHAIRLFRRHHRSLLGVGILRLHQRAWQHRFGSRPRPADLPASDLSAVTVQEAAVTYRLAAEAERRIQLALLADTIASDI